MFCFVLVGCSPETDSSPVVTQTENKAEPLELEAPEVPPLFFPVDDYDPERNALTDLAMTMELAAESKKRILIEVGGKW